MGVKLVSTSGGSVEVNPPATASNFTQTLVPVSNTLAPLVSGTAVASTSGTSIDFTGIPSWVKRITVMFSGVSTNGTSNLLIQSGSGSIATSGYVSASVVVNAVAGNSTTGITSTAGFIAYSASASNSTSGFFTLVNVSGNVWVSSNNLYLAAGNVFCESGAGTVTLGGTLDRVRITTANGTDTFDAGSINILYE